MNEVVRTALEESIAHWERIAAGTENAVGRRYCALCRLFNHWVRPPNRMTPWETNCEGCPVKKATGKRFCDDTPFEDFISTNDPAKLAASAKAETAFLRSLLPEPRS
jgi:hypothetical protein